MLMLMRRLIGTATDDGRRRRGSRRVCRSGFQARIGSGFLFDRRLLVDREELAFFAKPNAVFAAAMGIIGGHQTSNLSSPAMYYLVSYTAYLNKYQAKKTHHMRQRCDDNPTCCASCPRQRSRRAWSSPWRGSWGTWIRPRRASQKKEEARGESWLEDTGPCSGSGIAIVVIVVVVVVVV